MKNQQVLISGASIAGLTAAWWLQHVGYQVTVVELATTPRTNGAAVDLNEETVSIAKRMGLYEKLQAHHLGVDRIEYKNAADITEGMMAIPSRSDELELERDKFVSVLMAELGNVEFLFSNSISRLVEQADGIKVFFKQGEPRGFDLVIGADGAHSGTRKLWFGPEKDYAHFLGAYFSISIVSKTLVLQRTMQTFSVPYKSVMLNAYNGKTDIIFMFLAEEIAYDYRDMAAQRQIIAKQFADEAWRVPELLAEVSQADFYFDQFCQIKMPSWSKGRVVLIGDAAYCLSPAAGQGGSLAMQGAAALADALAKHSDYAIAFSDYEQALRDTIEEVQEMAEQNMKTHFILTTDEDIRRRNTEAKLF
ncbi:MAG: FAD-dependent monooxygenase [Mucilaginibacter sp.]|uniref:FAD-dependent monooxygenase n=1 Tax=Mucilaginibacter sp. TaxID=1882438 RepID=UPI0031A39ABA